MIGITLVPTTTQKTLHQLSTSEGFDRSADNSVPDPIERWTGQGHTRSIERCF